MNSQKEISPRTTVIVGILIVLLSVSLYLYIRHDTQKFVASLQGVPTTQPIDASLSSVSFTEPISSISEPEDTSSTSEPEDTSFTSEPEDVQEEKEEKKQTSVGASSKHVGCNHAGSHAHGSGSHTHADENTEDVRSNESERYGGLTIDDLNDLALELSQTNVPNFEEKFDLLEAALIDKLGPNPDIPKLIAKSKILHAADDMALTLDYSDAAEIDKYLNYEPIAVAKEILKLSASIYGYDEEVFAAFNVAIQDKAKEIENIKLLQETRPPLIQSAIDAGDLSPEEGEAVIKDATGLNVTMHKRKNVSTVNERTSPVENAREARGTTLPKNVDLNTPYFSGD
ncbi:MAG: hypothetical protein OXU23_12255 [Candidatus Poribacteria bacterium]|nr:hypothetical protein [Candidatus Poribacteria bacterium]MDE0468277.1 hypothetical protein [Candidatus Poribacteria bacterium]